MSTCILALILPLLLATYVSAQSTETVWSSFAYVLYGDRTPLIGPVPGAASLTPLGATQLFDQGSLFRERYLSGNQTLSDDQGNITGIFPIAGIERNTLDNTQLVLYSTTDDFVAGSALAFLQGLYPPVARSSAYNNGGMNASVLANGSSVDYPLDGYQYPNIQTLSILDPTSIWIEGHISCTQYWKSRSDARADADISAMYNNTYHFYQHLWSTTFAGTFPDTAVNFDYAYELYDYAQYQYSHNKTIRQRLAPVELQLLETLASDQLFSMNGNLSASGRQEGDMIRAVAGRTLAAKLVAQFQAHIASGGYSDKLNLMFGSFEPMLAFFSLSKLSIGHSNELFTSLPQPGSAMVFELFSEGDNSSSYPLVEDLWVRFLYRNGTDESQPFWEYPLFGLGNSESRMKWYDFVSSMNDFAIIDLGQWCDICNSVTLFCTALSQNAGGSRSLSIGAGWNSMTPTTAGVIGAAVTLAIIGLATAAAFVLGRLRIYRAGSGQNSMVGGFKGTEKSASDRDVSETGTGARHERVGSWELGGPAPSRVAGGSSLGNDASIFGATVVRDEGDNDSIMGQVPVKPREAF